MSAAASMGRLGVLGETAVENPYLINASDAVFMKMVSSAEEMESGSGTFHPVFTNQIFGENEVIFGYKNLRVNVYFAAHTLACYVHIEHDGLADKNQHDGVPPDDIVGLLRTAMVGVLPEANFIDLSTDRAHFLKMLDQPFAPFGDKVHEYEKDGETYETYKSTFDAFPQLQPYHARIQILVFMFIDGASYLDPSDLRWEIYLTWCRHISAGKPSFKFVGITTAYPFLAYQKGAGANFNNTRLRISQVVVLPPYQHKGHGAAIVNTIYREAVRRDVYEITVEDPTEDFTCLRDLIDLRNLKKHGFFQATPVTWTEEEATRIRVQLKINKRQARRAYEIFKLGSLDARDQAVMREFRLEVKARLRKENMDVKKGKMQEEEEKPEDLEKRKEELAAMYQSLESQYRNLLMRL